MVRSQKNRRSNEAGQSLIELIAMIVQFFTILFMFVQVSLSLGVANYFQYATYMAARALLPSRTTMQDQIRAARETLESLVMVEGRDRFPSIARAEGEGEPPGSTVGPSPRVRLGAEDSRYFAWEQGVSYKFAVKMYMLPILRRSRSNNKVILESESVLGREPSEAECLQQMAAKRALYDNGC